MTQATPLRAVTFNAWVGQDPEQLQANMLQLIHDTHEPHVVATQESERLRLPVKGYRVLDAGNYPREEAGMCKLLVRRDVEVRKLRIIAVPPHPPQWQGPKHDLWHPMRVWIGASLVLDDGEHPWDVLGGHRVPMGDTRNVAAYATEADTINRYLDRRHERRPYRPQVLLMDWNASKQANGPGDPARIAARHGGRLAMVAPDGALVINARPTRMRELDSRYGSDNHQPVALEFQH